ncbi:MAG: hypothetical protein E7616_05900 [Ruminococcaceae bacterium]|nr:hypothetical protein [Oscillospiraceae bacterium]
MKRNKMAKIWVFTGIAVLLLIGTILTIEYFLQEEKPLSRFPKDGIEAALKLNNAGYSVNVEDDMYMMASMSKDACDMYEIAFDGRIVSYLAIYDAEKTAMQAEIFYFEYEKDAKTLYEALKATWEAEGKDGQLRFKDKTVYMGYAKALDAFED